MRLPCCDEEDKNMPKLIFGQMVPAQFCKHFFL